MGKNNKEIPATPENTANFPAVHQIEKQTPPSQKWKRTAGVHPFSDKMKAARQSQLNHQGKISNPPVATQSPRYLEQVAIRRGPMFFEDHLVDASYQKSSGFRKITQLPLVFEIEELITADELTSTEELTSGDELTSSNEPIFEVEELTSGDELTSEDKQSSKEEQQSSGLRRAQRFNFSEDDAEVQESSGLRRAPHLILGSL